MNSHIVWVDTVSIGTVNLPGSTLPFSLSDRSASGTQTAFDRNLRTSLGLDPDGIDLIDLDALDPGQLSLDMFSPDELASGWEQSSVIRRVRRLGNKLTNKPSFSDFFTGRNDQGQNTRLQAPFEPIHMAGYVMDKFTFDDIIFNVGVRVDRYDANQSVLKDNISSKKPTRQARPFLVARSRTHWLIGRRTSAMTMWFTWIMWRILQGSTAIAMVTLGTTHRG